MTRLLPLLLLLSTLVSCDLQEMANQKFGDQHFKTAIALVELHKLRTGAYPERLNALEFTGDWDMLALASVEYEQLPTGYRLDLVRGWVGTPELSYPPAFWRGLGIVSSNVKRSD